MLRPCKEHIRERPKKPGPTEKGALCAGKKREIMRDKGEVGRNGCRRRVVCRSETARYRSKGLLVRL